MRKLTSIRRSGTTVFLCLLVTLGVSGCDAGEDPLAVVVTEETRGALALSMGVPALPDLVRAANAQDRLETALDRWSSSWGRPDAEGRRLRRQAYDEALPAVAASLGPARIGAELERLRRALDAVAELPEATLPAEFRDRIRGASELEGEGREALEAGRDGEALRRVAAGGDLLREIGPRNVALYLVERADEALQRIRNGGLVPSERDARRGSRMVLGAREALEENDFPLAIRRAYYACHLLGVEIDL